MIGTFADRGKMRTIRIDVQWRSVDRSAGATATACSGAKSTTSIRGRDRERSIARRFELAGRLKKMNGAISAIAAPRTTRRRFLAWPWLIRAAAVVFIASVSARAGAQEPNPGFTFETGNDLYEKCSTAPNTLTQGFCLGYSAGISDAMSIKPALNPVNTYSRCLSQNVTMGQIADVVEQYLQENPAKRHFAAIALIAEALANAFPCR
jgi:hypothetical protein